MIRCLIASTMLLPIRVKGRDIGEPQWGNWKFLKMANGKNIFQISDVRNYFRYGNGLI